MIGISLSAALALGCVLAPAEGPGPMPALGRFPELHASPCVSINGGEGPSLIGVMIPRHAELPAGIWLRALDRGPEEAARMHLVNGAVAQDSTTGCPTGGGASLACFITSTEPRWPMLLRAAPDRLWVAWVRRETTETHGLRADDPGPSPRTRISTRVEDRVLATVITLSPRQWMQGEAVTAVLGVALPPTADPRLSLRDGLPVVTVGGRALPLDTRYSSWNTGALVSRSASPPPPVALPPAPLLRACPGAHRMDCGSGCTDVRTDRRHCGGCGVDCGGQPCQGGRCGRSCYSDRDCRSVGRGGRPGRCLTPLVKLRGIPDRSPPCRPGGCGRWGRCDDGRCAPLACRTRADCPSGPVRCRPDGAGARICVPRGRCVSDFKVP